MSNPLLKDDVFRSVVRSDGVMTVPGVINKSMVLLVLLAISAFYSWTHCNIVTPLVIPITMVAFVLAMIAIFKKASSPFVAPCYAMCEGFILGSFSLYFEKLYPGIAVNAILLTMCVSFSMLAAYKTGLLKVTPKFQKIVIFSTFAIAFVYMIQFFLNIFGVGDFSYIHNSSGLGLVISFVIVAVAALNLVIDFDLIEYNARANVPKYMEWYCAFSLMITLVWLYFEILRLLSKLRK
ncbi:MAG: Bax inhibitor-1/YccA family protein [Endomicrobium sp.]|nr:Bax inhibitor-1/YccA family protein [Endomicrobium sp.]